MQAKTNKYQVYVFDMQRQEDRGNIKAFVDIKVGKSLRMYGFRIVQQPNQKAWVSPPQRSWKDSDGKTKYAPIVELSGDLKEEIEAAILAEFFKG